MSAESPFKIITNESQTPVDPGSSHKSKKIILGFIMMLSFLITGSLAYYWFVYNQNRVSTDNAYVESDMFTVSCRVMGYVKEVLVSENQTVKKGQVLALLDDSDFKVELAYKTAKFKKAEADWSRAQALFKARAISKSDFEMAEAGFIMAQADHDGTELKIKYTQIISPVDGVIGKKTVELGQFVQPGQGLFVILPHGNLWVKGNFKETQISKIKIGQKVEILIDAYPDQKFMGHVDSVFPTSGSKLSILPPENATGNFTKIVQRISVKIVFEQTPPNYIRAGMSAYPVILTQSGHKNAKN